MILTVEHIQKVTKFKTKKLALAVLDTLHWLEDGAPHKIGKKNLTFNMSFFLEKKECGTACCIAGAIVQFGKITPKFDIEETFNVWADDENELYNLFYPEVLLEKFPDKRWESITPEEAAKTLRHYLETGVVDWLQFIEE